MSGISVIIPTKNRLSYLIHTIQNLLAQSLRPDEIIVIDDLSEDNTYEYLKKNYRDNVEVLKGKGKGPGAARNLGMQVATGKYVQFFDSDDLMTSNKLELQHSVLKSTNCGMVYSPYLYAAQINNEWKATEPILSYFPLPENKNMLHYLIKGWNTITQACLFTRDLLLEVGSWNEELMTHEDYLYLFEVSRKITLPIHVKGCGVIYRQHGDQLTNSQSTSLMRASNIEKVLTKVLSYPELSWYHKEFIRGRLSLNSRSVEKSNFDENLLSRIFAILIRMENKIGRVRTGSNWQTWHGVFSSEKQVQNIIADICFE